MKRGKIKKENRNLKPSSPMSTVLIDSFEKLLPYRTLLTFWIPDDHRIGKEREKERMLLRRRCCCTAQLRDLIQTKGTRKIGDRLVWSIFPFLFFSFFLFSGPRAVEFSWVRSVSSHIVYTYIYINIELKKEKRRIERESENEGKFSRPSSMDWVPECRPSLARAPRTTFSLSKKIFPKKSLPDKFSVLRPFFFSSFVLTVAECYPSPFPILLIPLYLSICLAWHGGIFRPMMSDQSVFNQRMANY